MLILDFAHVIGKIAYAKSSIILLKTYHRAKMYNVPQDHCETESRISSSMWPTDALVVARGCFGACPAAVGIFRGKCHQHRFCIDDRRCTHDQASCGSRALQGSNNSLDRVRLKANFGPPLSNMPARSCPHASTSLHMRRHSAVDKVRASFRPQRQPSAASESSTRLACAFLSSRSLAFGTCKQKFDQKERGPSL